VNRAALESLEKQKGGGMGGSEGRGKTAGVERRWCSLRTFFGGGRKSTANLRRACKKKGQVRATMGLVTGRTVIY